MQENKTVTAHKVNRMCNNYKKNCYKTRNW